MQGQEMNELVSIIIPVYNTAKYLDECVDSVIKQTYKNLEIILVDDGSTDESPELCELWKIRDDRIKVIHKENEGLGYTRNAGLLNANGEFVSFLDSDDYLDLNTVEKCVLTFQNEKADACFYGRYTQGTDGIYRAKKEKPQKLIYSNEEVLGQFTSHYLGKLPWEKEMPYIQASACCGMYRRKIIEDYQIRFYSERDVLSEDTFFNLDICRYSSKIVIIPFDFYFYRYNGNSLTKRYNPKRLEQLRGFLKKISEYRDLDIYRQLDSIDLRIDNMKYIYFRHSVEYEVLAQKEKGFKFVVDAIKKLCDDQDLTGLFKNFQYNKFGTKAKVFVYMFTHNHPLCLAGYYWGKRV